jgi:hypothetical protein
LKSSSALGPSPDAPDAAWWAVALLLLLGAGLLPVWALSLQTPFRLIDDYGAVLPVWDRSPWEHLSSNLFLREQVRFRPVHDLGQFLAFGLFSADYRLHHGLRLVMKAMAFGALLAVALRHVEALAGRSPGPLGRLVTGGLAFSLFFYFPNNPEARLSPQELATVLYFMGSLFFLTGGRVSATSTLSDVLGVLCFALALWSKEPNVIPGAVVLALILAETAARPGRRPTRTVLLRLIGIGVWVHAALKVTVLSVGGGYGRPPLEWSVAMAMAREIPRQLMLASAVVWAPLLFAAGLLSFVWLGIRRAPSGVLRRRSALLLCLLLGSVVQYVLMWTLVLRYAYPAVCLLILLTVIGFGLLLSRSRTPGGLRRRSLAVAVLALAFALANYRDMTAQFSTQYVAAMTENTMLEQVERLMSVHPDWSFFVRGPGEHDHRVAFYFNRHVPLFFRRRTAITLRRATEDIPVGGYWVTRLPSAPGFERLTEVPAHPQPGIVAVSTAVSRIMRLGRPAPDPPVDAGAPGLVQDSWFVLRRVPEVDGGGPSAASPPRGRAREGDSGPGPAR